MMAGSCPPKALGSSRSCATRCFATCSHRVRTGSSDSRFETLSLALEQGRDAVLDEIDSCSAHAERLGNVSGRPLFEHVKVENLPLFEVNLAFHFFQHRLKQYR